MSIQRRLAISITLVLVLSLLFGSALTYWHVVAKVRTEMRAALVVGTQTASKTMDGRYGTDDMATRLRRTVDMFDGDRHLAAVLTSSDGRVLARSTLQPPDEPAPDWFYTLVAGPILHTDVPLVTPFSPAATLRLSADPRNEVSEAWSDVLLTVGIMAVFFATVLALAYWTIRTALKPIRDVCAALLRVGTGDYTTRMKPIPHRELEPLRQGFDTMAERLGAMRAQNQALHEQILNLQEEERAELARDLHDEVAPFLFSVGADAAMIRRFVADGAIDPVGPRAEAIADSVRHMQKHVKAVLRRLAPETLIDLGLAGAIDNLAAFWKMRRPEIAIHQEVMDDPVDPPLDAVAFRTVQESLSNAIRHGAPKNITVRVEVADTTVTIAVWDDGSGLGGAPAGFGLTGMRERIRGVGGTLTIRDRADGPGTIVEAVLPIALVQDETRIEELLA